MNLDADFVHRLPKAELHAHLTGSISKNCLHEIWVKKTSQGQCLDLEDPMKAINPGGDFVDVFTFFPLFDKYIYNLVNDIESVKYATSRVIQEFAADGVAHLELRTTPRENLATGMTMNDYVHAVNDVVAAVNSNTVAEGDDSLPVIKVYLLLSIDRKMSPELSMKVIDLARKYQHSSCLKSGASGNVAGFVVGVDLCGNPTRGDVSTFTPAFQAARDSNLGITIHFAEVPQSSTDKELETILSWQPGRLGHVINVPENIKNVIKERKIGLELCLSCNVLAKLTTGGFASHHFREWHSTDCPIALSTDDVGVFASPLSSEYLLAAQHFNLGPEEVVKLSRSAARAVFTGQRRLLDLIGTFEKDLKHGSNIGGLIKPS